MRLPLSSLCVALAVLVSAPCGCECLRRMEQRFGWRSVDFAFPSSVAREAAIRSGSFVPGNAIPLDVDVWASARGEKVFVTLPRLQPGTPATLATIVENSGAEAGAPLMAPYPDWSWNRQGACDGLVSVFRVQVDRCNRLWVPDTGRVDILSEFRLQCPPKLVVFDLERGKPVRKHAFAAGVVQQGSLPVTIAVDVRGGGSTPCDTAFAYVADVTEFGLLVYDMKRDMSWRIMHNYFYPYPQSGIFNIAGDTFDLMDGILGLALSPVLPSGERRLYFHSLASVKESWVSASVLRNSSLFEGGANRARRQFSVSDGERASQSAAEAMDSSGVLFFSLLAKNSVNCWPAATGTAGYSQSTITELDQDDVALQFASGVKVVRGADGRESLYVLTSRFQKLMTSGIDPADVNFRVLRADVRTLVKGTACDVQPSGVRNYYKPVVFPGPSSARARSPTYNYVSRRRDNTRAMPRVTSANNAILHQDNTPTHSSWWMFTYHPPPCRRCWTAASHNTGWRNYP